MSKDDIERLEGAVTDLEIILETENWFQLSDSIKKQVVEHAKNRVEMVKQDMEFERKEELKEGYESVDKFDYINTPGSNDDEE